MNWRTGVTALCLAVSSTVVQAQSTANRVEFGGEADLGVALEQPRDMRFTRSGVVVVENSAPFVRLLSRSGRLLHAGVKAGSGPGEVRHISVVTISSSRDALLIFDPALRRVSRFRITDSISLIDAHSIPLEVDAACLLGGTLWVSGIHDTQGIVHRLSIRDGKYVVAQSLGTYKVGHPLQGNRLFGSHVVASRMLCNEAKNQIVVASKRLGILQRIDITTGAVSMVRVLGFEPLHFAMEGNSMLVQRGPQGVTDEILSDVEQSNGYLVIVGRTDKTHRGEGDFLSVREVLVPFNVTESSKVRQLKEIALNPDGPQVLSYSAAPFPTGAIESRNVGQGKRWFV
jgi:hypothetical protein